MRLPTLTSSIVGSLLLLAAFSAWSADADDVALGQRIYREGILPSGAPLTGTRFDSAVVSGAQAACVNCHRPSGMGGVEGDIPVSPINSRFLFAALDDKAMATMDPRFGKKMNLWHPPYTDETLAGAIRHGTTNSGREMSLMMPRYTLDGQEMSALNAYLRQLSAQWSPGVSADKIRFATIVTPGVEPARRKVMLDMIRTAFNQKNSSTLPGRRHMISPAEMILRTERTWDLDIWELQGKPETWNGQLEAFYRRQPVFAVISGLSDDTWEPVQQFCEHEQVPCWFPSVDLPPTAAQPFYPIYFSRGVALDAEVLAKYLREDGKARPRRVVQIFRDNEVGQGAARALAQALAGSGIALENRILHQEEDTPGQALGDLKEGDSVMFWLRPADIAALASVTPPKGAAFFFSGRLAGDEQKRFAPDWKSVAQLVYPYELPEKREVNLRYFHAWLKRSNLPLVDEPLQSEIFFAVNFLTDTVAEMLHNLYRDYLLERAENMISKREAGKAEEETRDRVMLRPTVNMPMKPGTLEVVGKRESTTVYPRLTLGPGQRFASKGGYIARFSADGKLVAESGWIIL